MFFRIASYFRAKRLARIVREQRLAYRRAAANTSPRVNPRADLLFIVACASMSDHRPDPRR